MLAIIKEVIIQEKQQNLIKNSEVYDILSHSIPITLCLPQQ